MTYEDPDLGPVRSALTLRLWLAGFGLVFCAVAGGIAAVTGPLWLAVVLLVLAAVAAVDIVVILRRKRGERPAG